MISAGVLREVPPLPPAMYSPVSFQMGFHASLSAPQTTVVTPLECQSYPNTQPNA